MLFGLFLLLLAAMPFLLQMGEKHPKPVSWGPMALSALMALFAVFVFFMGFSGKTAVVLTREGVTVVTWRNAVIQPWQDLEPFRVVSQTTGFHTVSLAGCAFSPERKARQAPSSAIAAALNDMLAPADFVLHPTNCGMEPQALVDLLNRARAESLG